MNRKSVSEPVKVKVPRMQTVLLPMALALFALTACDRRDPPVEPVTSSPPPNTAAPTAQTPAPPAADMTDPAKGPATDVTQKGEPETGMAGGASRTVASDGKPGTGTDAGAGTGAAQSSDSKEQTKDK